VLESSFHQVLEVAARLRVLRVGEVTLALDGTKILANASKHSAVSHGHAVKQMVLLEEQIAELLAKADAADSAPLEDGLSVPGEIARRRERLEKLREATAVTARNSPPSRPSSASGRKSKRRQARNHADASPSARKKARGPRTNTTSPMPRAA
jgi:hypothetical protein